MKTLKGLTILLQLLQLLLLHLLNGLFEDNLGKLATEK